MDTKSVIGHIEVGSLWECMGIQTITNAAGPQVLTPPTTGGVTVFNTRGAPKFATVQASVTTWSFTDITTVSPTTAACQYVNPGNNPMVMPVRDLSKLQFWCTTAAASLFVHYYK